VHTEAYGAVVGLGDSEIHSGHKTWVEARDNTSVTGIKSDIFAYDNATVTNLDGFIEANGNATVFAYDSEVVLNDNATIQGDTVSITDNRTAAIDTKTMEDGFEVPKPVLPPTSAQEATGVAQFTEPTENGKEKMRENPPPHKKNLKTRFGEKAPVVKKQDTQEAAEKAKKPKRDERGD
jgi:hypothetical protein